MKTITTILVAAAIAAPVPLAFAAETQNSTGTTHASHHDAKFIRDAAEGNAAEIGLAEIASRMRSCNRSPSQTESAGPSPSRRAMLARSTNTKT
jgi:Spy/CpxP family protein refolding chaperone